MVPKIIEPKVLLQTVLDLGYTLNMENVMTTEPNKRSIAAKLRSKESGWYGAYFYLVSRLEEIVDKETGRD